MKLPYIIDLAFIIVLAGVLVTISELGIAIKIGYLFIPFLICYYIGRYATHYINKAK